MDQQGKGPQGPTRRIFLEQLAKFGGTALLFAGMDALGFGIGSAMAAPPRLEGTPKDRKSTRLNSSHT